MWYESFKNEIEKNADLINKNLFNKLNPYTQERIISVRDALALATSDKTKLPTNIREKIIEGAIEELKRTSWDLAQVGKAGKKDKITEGPVEVSKPKKKYVL